MSETQNDGQPTDNLADLRAAADKGRKLERENAFLKAGIPVDTGVGSLLLKAYEGPLDQEALKAAWAEYSPPPANPATPEVTEQAAGEAVAQQQAQALEAQAALDAQQRQDQARRGIASGPTVPPVTEVAVDPLKEGYERYNEALAKGQSRDQAQKHVIDAIVGSAAAGDERFIFDGWTEEELQTGRTARA